MIVMEHNTANAARILKFLVVDDIPMFDRIKPRIRVRLDDDDDVAVVVSSFPKACFTAVLSRCRK